MEMEGKVVTRVADPMALEMDEKAGIDVEENDAANIDELMEKDTKSEADVGRIIMYRQIGAKVAYSNFAQAKQASTYVWCRAVTSRKSASCTVFQTLVP